MLSRLLSCMAIVFLPAIAHAQDPKPAPEAEAKLIEAKGQAWVHAVEARDLDRLLSLYTADAVVLEPGIEEDIVGHEAIRAFYQPYLKLPGLSIPSTPTEIIVAASGDLAFELGEFTFSAEGRDGPMHDRGRYIVLWRKSNGEWKIAREMTQSTLPRR